MLLFNDTSPLVKPEIAYLDDLFANIDAGKVRVPKFQRPFIWNPSDMINLFDSIYKGYPIGSLLLWETSEQVEHSAEIGCMHIRKSVDGPLTYVLDGHQRVSTLYSCLRLPVEAPITNNQKDWKWWIWFNLKDKIFTHVSKANPEPWLFPVRSILKTVDFLEETRRIYESCGKEAEHYITEADQLAQKIKSYRVAIIKIEGGGLSQAVEIFSRLNSKGKTMAVDQMVSALTYGAGNTHLADKIDNILYKLTEYGFGNLSRITIFRSIIAAANMNVVTNEWELIAKKLGHELGNIVNKVEKSVILATNFLRQEIGVPCDKLLPYSQQFVLLSEFFRCCPAPSKKQIEKLRLWFWVTSFGGWFAGANTTQINNAVDEIRSFAENPTMRFNVMRLDDMSRPFPDTFDMRSARVRALLILMLQLKPLTPEIGAESDLISLLSESGNQALPYVFPRARRKALSSPANRIFIKRVPGKSVKEQISEVDDKYLHKFLISHGIPWDAFESLNNDDDKGFIEKRAAYLSRYEYDFMTEIGVSKPTVYHSEVDIDTDGEETL